MIGRTNAIGGMNGNVVRVICEMNQPSTTLNNTIWVRTDRNVPEWSISPSAPIAPKTWMVWIVNGIPSEASFNILKNNELNISISDVKIYNGSKWKRLAAFIYQQNSWIPVSENWDGELYMNGTDYTDVTGGWEAVPLPHYEGEGSGPGHVSYEKNRMVYTAERDNVLFIRNKIDLTNYNRLIFTGQLCDNKSWTWIGIWNNRPDYAQWGTVANGGGDNATRVVIDISHLKGKYVIGFPNYANTIIINQLYMEK